MINKEEIEKILDEALKTKKIELDVLNRIVLYQNNLKNIYTFLLKNNVEIIIENKKEKNDNKYINESLKKYLNEISKYPVLTPQEEKSLLIAYKNGDEKARMKLIESNLKLVVSIANKYRNRIFGTAMDFFDIIQDGNNGLFIAIEKFKLSKENNFSTYAICCINESILKKIYDFERAIRIPSNEIKMLDKIKKYETQNYYEYGVPSTKEEYMIYLGINEKEFYKLLYISEGLISLDTPSSTEEERKYKR